MTVGDRRYVQEVRSESSYISNNDMRLHFGLGSSNAVIQITVRWPAKQKNSLVPLQTVSSP